MVQVYSEFYALLCQVTEGIEGSAERQNLRVSFLLFVNIVVNF